MSRLQPSIVAVVAGLLLCGCTASPWSNGRVPLPQNNASKPLDSSDRQEAQDVMAEVRELGESDPAAQQRLLNALQQSDPSLWPLVVAQAKATSAYRQRAAQQSIAAAPVDRLPPVTDLAASASAPAYPQTSAPPVETPAPASAAPEQVVQTNYAGPVRGDWQQRLAAAIEAMESDVPPSASTPSEVAQHARLRMLYAAAGRREDAARPIPAATPAAQQFLTKELEGLTAWFDAERTPDAAARAAEVKPVLAEALAKLSESAPLTVRNVAFCTEVQSYGCMKKFDQYEFQPNQEVLLYAEVENFASESTPKGYHTSLRSSYQIVDATGKSVGDRTFAPTEEYCQNLRRDFFIGYHLRLPKDIAPGTYTLRLSIKDLKCDKSGEATVNFEVKDSKPQTSVRMDATSESKRVRRG